MAKSICIYFLAIMAAVMQASFLPWFRVGGLLNPVLLSAAFILLFDFRLALKWGFAAGLVLDLNSLLPFGSITILLLFIIAGAKFLFDNFLTNRSFYSFSILAMGGVVLFELGLLGLGWLARLAGTSAVFFSPGTVYFINFLAKIAVNFAFIYVTYLVLSKTKAIRGLSRQY